MIPAMTIKARLLAVRKVPAGTPISYGRTFVTARPSVIGVVSAGYADAFCRRFSNNATVLVRGEKAPVVGRVCMDLSMVDVTDIADVAEGDEVVLIGRQGNACITASELAERAGTIPYEILTALGHRARKLYAHVA
jgi:alanine racemase